MFLNFNFSLLLNTTHEIITLSWNSEDLFINLCTFTISVFDSKLTETPFTSKVIWNSTHHAQLWLFVFTDCYFENVDSSFVGGARNVFVAWINTNISNYCLISTSSYFMELTTVFGAVNSNQCTFITGCTYNTSILTQFKSSNCRVMSFELYYFFLVWWVLGSIIEVYNFNHSKLLIRARKYTVVFLSR